jgi:hypothetical protein
MSVAERLSVSRESQERVTQTVVRFLHARVKLDELIAMSASEGRIPFDAVNAFVENELFELKEESHALFRNEENSEEVNLTSAGLFDILLGSLFHQMMKVKESTYQVERYAPKYAALREAIKGHRGPEHGKSFLHEGERILQRARRSLRQDLAHATEVFQEATVVLRHVLVENRDNALLVRNLLDNKELVEAVYGPKSLEKLLRDMYDGAAAHGYIIAAEDLLDGGWYDRAREYCQQALRIDSKNANATHLLSRINAAARAHLK